MNSRGLSSQPGGAPGFCRVTTVTMNLDCLRSINEEVQYEDAQCGTQAHGATSGAASGGCVLELLLVVFVFYLVLSIYVFTFSSSYTYL